MVPVPVPVPTFEKVTVPVPVPAPYLDHKKQIKKKNLEIFLIFYPFNTFISFKQFYIPSIQNRLLLTMTAKNY